MEEEILTPENVGYMLEWLPTPEEIRVAKKFDGNIEDLEAVET